MLAPSTSNRAHGSLQGNRRLRLSPMEALERGFALFRSTFAGDAWRYYIGAAPLVVAFIPMWVLNGQIRISTGTLLLQAILLTAAYLLRVLMVGSYMRRVREQAFGGTTAKSYGVVARAAALSRLLVWKILFTAGVLLTLPSIIGPSWFYGASEFASLQAMEDGGERHSFSGCLALSGQWLSGGLLLLLMLFPLWIAIGLNCLILAAFVPQLLHSIFGVNTLLSTAMGMYSLVQSSAFWFSLIAAMWLALDPIVKCTIVVVHQHLRSRHEGDDLRAQLANLPREQQKKAEMMAAGSGGKSTAKALCLLGALLLGACLPSTAYAAQAVPTQNTAQQRTSESQPRVEKLRQALQSESQRSIYRWHDAEHPEPPSKFDLLLEKIGRSLGRAIDAIRNFLRKLWPSGLNLPVGDGKSGGWHLRDLRLWLVLIATVTLIAGGVLFWLRRRRTPVPVSVPLEVAALPELSDNVIATERSEDEWFSLANRLEREGQLRLALRAAYLGLLAGLAQREWLTIRRDRTNREYLDEFTRRWRRRPQAAAEARTEIPETLRGSLRQFDRVWYGAHAVTAEGVTEYRQAQRELLNHV